MLDDVGQGRYPARDACCPCLLVRPEEHSLRSIPFLYSTMARATKLLRAGDNYVATKLILSCRQIRRSQKEPVLNTAFLQIACKTSWSESLPAR